MLKPQRSLFSPTYSPVHLFSPNLFSPVRLALVLLFLAAVWPGSTARAISLEPGWPRTTGFSVSQSGAAAQFDADPQLEIAIASQDGSAYIYNHDGTLLPGWPHYMGSALGPDQFVNQCSSPAVYDIDGDGQMEMIVGNFDGKMYAFNADGSLVPGWPFSAAWMIFSTPAVGEIDGDPTPEVVFGANDGRIYALNSNGTLCAGFPVVTPYVVRSSPALGDLDGDGLDEIAITADNTSYHLYVLDGNGANLPGFPMALGVGAISSPTLADIDRDGSLDIAVGSRDGYLHVLRANGTYLPGWPVLAGYSLQSSPTVVNLDADPQLEIIVGLNDSKVCVYNHDGTLMPGWPQTTTYTVVSSASVGDIDADGQLEIVIGENTGKVYAWNVDGTAVPGFPLLDATYTIYSSPLLADLDLDGHLELLVGCNDTRIYCWDLGPGTYNPALLPWPKWRLHQDNDAAAITVDPASANEDAPDGIASRGSLSPIFFPNPTRGAALFRYHRATGSSASAAVMLFDAQGRLVRTLLDGLPGGSGPAGASTGLSAGASTVEAAEGRIVWDGQDASGRPVAPGVYVYRLSAGGRQASGRFVVYR